MTDHIDALVGQFERLTRDVIAFTEGLSDADWETLVPNEQRAVGVLIQHIAFGYTAEVDLMRAIVEGRSIPNIYESRDALDAVNARDAEELRGGTKEEALRLLQERADAAVRFLRSLSDADLKRSQPLGLWGGADISVEYLVTRILLGHPNGHLDSIREALAGAP